METLPPEQTEQFTEKAMWFRSFQRWKFPAFLQCPHANRMRSKCFFRGLDSELGVNQSSITSTGFCRLPMERKAARGLAGISS